jgi:predicted RNA binding protein YcfA (HicA-like mRNA interferase family)
MKRIDLLKHLKQYNCRLHREGGNHSIYINDTNQKKTAVGRHKEIDSKMCRKICTDLEIPMPPTK